MKNYFKKYEFLIISIVIYCFPIILSFLVYQVFLLIENHNQIQNFDNKTLYAHPSYIFIFLEGILSLISFIGSFFLSRFLFNLSRYKWVNITTTILFIIGLVGFLAYAPSLKNNIELHKKRNLLRLVTEISKGKIEEIGIRFEHKERNIGMFIDYRDFNTYEIVNISNNSQLRKIELPIKTIKIQNVTLLGDNVNDLYGIIVISKDNREKFYLKDTSNNILGIDLEIIKKNH